MSYYTKEYPQAIDAETWLLGGILQDPKVMAQHGSALDAKDFYLEKNSRIWLAMQKLQEENNPIDIVTVGAKAKELFNNNSFDNLFGSNDYLFTLMESVSSAANIEHYIELVAKASALRNLITVSQKLIKKCIEPSADADELTAQAIDDITAIIRKTAKTEDLHIAYTATEVLEQLKQHWESCGKMGTATGFYALDSLTGGLRPGEVTILGARPGMGKTSLAIDIALNISRNMPVKFFSLEMAKTQIVPKTLCFYSQVSLKRTTNATLDEFELEQQQHALAELKKLNLFMEFSANMKISELCADIHSFVAKHGKAMIIIDHLHFMKTDDKKSESRNIELGKITHALKELAKKLEIPVLLLSQLNRDTEKAQAKVRKPRLSDLRDSGNIEQDADMVWFIHRAGYYDNKIPPYETDIIVAKNRMGPTGMINLHFDTNTTKFSDVGVKPLTDSEGYV